MIWRRLAMTGPWILREIKVWLGELPDKLAPSLPENLMFYFPKPPIGVGICFPIHCLKSNTWVPEKTDASIGSVLPIWPAHCRCRIRCAWMSTSKHKCETRYRCPRSVWFFSSAFVWCGFPLFPCEWSLFGYERLCHWLFRTFRKYRFQGANCSCLWATKPAKLQAPMDFCCEWQSTHRWSSSNERCWPHQCCKV